VVVGLYTYVMGDQRVTREFGAEIDDWRNQLGYFEFHHFMGRRYTVLLETASSSSTPALLDGCKPSKSHMTRYGCANHAAGLERLPQTSKRSIQR
jgi:hypothetical protein